jgi:hypothetical protein
LGHIDDLLKLMDEVDSIMRRVNLTKIESSIPRLIELLDIYQNAHLSEAAEKVADCLISLGSLIVPYLNLKTREVNFIHFIAYEFIPKCSDKLILDLKNELWSVITQNDLTEETDLHLIRALLEKNNFVDELKLLLEKKSRDVEEEMAQGKRNKLILQDYLDSVKKVEQELNL